MFVKVITITLAVCCLLSFSWGRRNFFVKSAEVSRHRGGLAPLGSIFGVLVIIALVLDEIELQITFPDIGAVVMLATSLLLFWWAARSFGENKPSIAFSPGAPLDLVIDGPYRFIRHPFYSSYMMFWLAFAVHSWSILALIPALIMGRIYYRAARNEEKEIMSSHLRDVYMDYSRSAGMFFPRLIGGK